MVTCFSALVQAFSSALSSSWSREGEVERVRREGVNVVEEEEGRGEVGRSLGMESPSLPAALKHCILNSGNVENVERHQRT